VEGSCRTVQHLEGGIVREILVRDGDKVEAGQVLVRLDQIQSDSMLETQRSAVWSLQAQMARLAAEQAGLREISFLAMAAILPRQFDDVGRESLFVVAAPRRLALCRARLTEHRAGAAL
jgi:HlyD family secretion protein